MSKVNFDKDETKKDNTWFWHYGTFVDVNGKEHPFSVCEMSCPVGSGINTFELTWVETTPTNDKEAEKIVLADKYFTNSCN